MLEPSRSCIVSALLEEELSSRSIIFHLPRQMSCCCWSSRLAKPCRPSFVVLSKGILHHQLRNQSTHGYNIMRHCEGLKENGVDVIEFNKGTTNHALPYRMSARFIRGPSLRTNNSGHCEKVFAAGFNQE